MTNFAGRPRFVTLLLVLGLAMGAGAAWERLSRHGDDAGVAGAGAAAGTEAGVAAGAGDAEAAGVRAAEAGVAAPAASAETAPALPERDAVLRSTLESGRAILVYGGATPAEARRYEAALRNYVQRSRGLLRRVHVDYLPAAAAPAETLASALGFLVGTPASSEAVRRVTPALPVIFRENGFELFGRTYSGPGDVVSVSLRNPLDPAKLMLVLTGNSDAAILGHIENPERGAWFSDYVVWRNGEIIRSGEYRTDAQGAWVFDPATDQDRLAWTEEYEKNLMRVERGSVTLEIPRGLAENVDTAALAAELDARAVRMARQVGLAGVTPPIVVHYYPDMEWKGKLSGEVVDEHADAAGLHAHRVFDPARPAGDGIAEAEALLHRAVGTTPCAWLKAGSILWLSDSWLGVPLSEWPGRLKGMGVWLPPREYVGGEFEHHSYFFSWPAAGAFVRFYAERHGVDGWRALYRQSLADPELSGFVVEAMPDPAAAAGGIPARPRLDADGPAPRRGNPVRDAFDALRGKGSTIRAAAFDRGMCYAHDYSLDFGYGSEKSRRNLEYLRDANSVNAVSISPFGYISGAHDPEISHRDRVRGRAGSNTETDESLIMETARAHGLGMKVLLSPHLWGRVWCGEWGAESETEWPRFFSEYRAFILHYAALAEYAGCDLFMVGKELSATASRSAEWRSVIADVRRIYTGPVTYGANWDSEYRDIDWWDAVDFIGVSQYTPLSPAENPPDAELVAGVRVVAGHLDELAMRYARPYLLTEVGFTAQTTAAVTPWESFDSDGRADLDLQARCYDAVLKVFSDRPACAGTYWWKWFTYLPSNNTGRNRFDYPPYGKPAEQVLRRWYTRLSGEAARG